MAYTKTVWTDRQVTNPLRFSFTLISGTAGTTGSVYDLVPNEGTISTAGTPINATNLNNIENGIFNLDAQVTTNTSDILSLQNGRVLRAGDTMTGTLTAPTLNATGNLQEGGTNLTSKYLLRDGSNTLTGGLTQSMNNPYILFNDLAVGGGNMAIANTGLKLSFRWGANNSANEMMYLDGTSGLVFKPNLAFTGAGTIGQSGIHMKNSDIVGVNGLYMNDTSDSTGEGFNFLKSTGASGSTTQSDYYNLRIDGNGKLTQDGDLIYEPTPTWTSITLQNGATINNSRTPRYRKANGIVYIQGEIGTVADGTVIGTLPVGYRHNNGTGMNFTVAVANSAKSLTALVSIGSTGAITVVTKAIDPANGLATASPICFNGISFPADQ